MLRASHYRHPQRPVLSFYVAFGVASAPALFKRMIETVLQDLSRVACYLDNILIRGATLDEHMQTLENVL